MSAINSTSLTLEDFSQEIVGYRRVGKRIPLKILHLLIRGHREVVRQGLRWRLDYHESRIHQRIIKGDIYEAAEIKQLFSEAKRQGSEIFLDIGANIGLYSLLAARLNIFKEIHALEPVPENYSSLQWHIQSNGLAGRIFTYPYAASDSSRGLTLVRQGRDNGGWKAETAEAISGGREVVPAVTLDSLFNWENRKLVIKIDVEKHEFFCLRGAEKLFAGNQILMQLEIHPGATNVIDYLLARNFRILSILNNRNYYFTNRADIA